MDILLHITGLAFIPIILYILLLGIGDIFSVINRRNGIKDIHFINDAPFDHLPV